MNLKFVMPKISLSLLDVFETFGGMNLGTSTIACRRLQIVHKLQEKQFNLKKDQLTPSSHNLQSICYFQNDEWNKSFNPFDQIKQVQSKNMSGNVEFTYVLEKFEDINQTNQFYKYKLTYKKYEEAFEDQEQQKKIVIICNSINFEFWILG